MPADILTIFTPLLWEMEDSGTTLDMEGFLEASARLYDSLSIDQKSVLIGFARSQSRSVKRSQSFQGFTFRV